MTSTFLKGISSAKIFYSIKSKKKYEHLFIGTTEQKYSTSNWCFLACEKAETKQFLITNLPSPLFKPFFKICILKYIL